MGGLDQYMSGQNGDRDDDGKAADKNAKPIPAPGSVQPPKAGPSKRPPLRDTPPAGSQAPKEDAEEEPDEPDEGEPLGREAEQEEVIEATSFEAETPQDTGPCVMLSVSYSGRKRKALVKLYDIERKRIVFWYDNTGHQPYLLTNIPLKAVLADPDISSHPGFDAKASREVRKYDLLNDRERTMTLIAGKDPTTVGGRPDSIREYLKDSWEDHIRYRDCYILDKQLIPGSIYRITNGSLIREGVNVPTDAIREKFPKASPEFLKSLYEWFPLLVSPVPDYRRVAIDIEVETEAQDRIPDPEVAKGAVICVSLAGSDGLKKVLLLRRPGRTEGARPEELPADVNLIYYDSELALLKELFRHFLDYPIVMTFNGDNFDLHYLWRRAQVLGMRKDEVPITMGREIALMPTAIHFDLYKFFHNHAIQIYAFSHAYKETSLNAISESLLKIKKIELDRPINDLDYLALASYCFRDSLITLRLTQENSNVAMHLTTLIMRISRLSMEDATRQGVSSWIRNLFYFEHRAKNCLIPRQDDIERMKGGSSTTAIIKGKKYQGAVVIKPESGAFFNVVVLDFASLYPSIISRWNLSYETVECGHPECRANKVPGTDHWVCTKRTGMMSLIVGLLKDVRVKWFKPMSKDQSLPEEERSFYKVVQQALKVFLNACFTGDTEILTTVGPKNIKEIMVGDKVINVNPITLETEVDEVVDTQVFDFAGDLLHFENNRTTDLMVTPDHKMLIKGKEREAIFTTANEIFKSRDLIIPKLVTPSVKPSAFISLLEIGKRKGWGLAIRLAAPEQRHVDSAYPALWKFIHSFHGHYHKCSKTFFMPDITDVSEDTISKIVALGGKPYLAKFNQGHIIRKQNRIPPRIDLSKWAALCGWIVSEGSLGHNSKKTYSNGRVRGENLHIDIAQYTGKGNPNGQRFREDIESLLNDIDIKFSIGKRSFRISNELLYYWISENCYSREICKKCGIKECSHLKRIPEIIIHANIAVQNSFLQRLYHGDGTARQTLYSTTSETLSLQLQAILGNLGYSSKRFYDRPSNLYRLTWRNTNQHTDHWIKTKVPYTGKVYCVTTKKNHTVFAGRNGRLSPCGQCYGVFGAEIFPLYCLALADSTTAIGRSIITDTINQATDMGVKVLYGDSVAGSSVVSVDEGGKRSDVPIESLFRHPDQSVGGKEYCYPASLRALSLDPDGRAVYSRVNAIMRHRSGKRMFRVRLTDSWHIDVTEDHSLIGYRDDECSGSSGTGGHLVEVRPAEIGKAVKRLVVLKDGPLVAGRCASSAGFDAVAPLRIEEVPYDGYVYDLEIEGTRRFFANSVLVHNTDSIFLHQPTKDQIKSLLGWAESNLGIDLEVDKRYSFVAFSGRKKNYLGVMENGNVDIKGLMGKKRNTPPFIKGAFAEMTQVLRDVKTPADFENAKLMIKEIVQGCYTSLKARKVPLDGLIFKVMLARSVEHYTKTTPQHVKAAKQLADKGKEVKPGDLISFVKVTGKEGVKPVQLARIDEVDVEKYVGHIQSTFGQVLDALDIEFDEIVGVKRLEFFSK